jgi:hypothetical protein
VRKTVASLLIVGLLLGLSTPLLAQQAKPLVTATFAGYDKLVSNVEYIGKIAQQPDLAKGLEETIAKMTGSDGKGIPGLDGAKPWCVVVQTKGEEFPVYAFVPVTDFKKLMETLPKLNIEVKQDGDVYEIAAGAQTMFVAGKGNWAVLATSAEALKDAPADPLALVGDMYKRYDLAVHVAMQNVPQQFRKMIVDQLEMGIALGTERMPGETDEMHAIRQNMARQSLKQITSLFEEVESLQLGLAIDQQSKSAYLDLDVKAVPGTETAKDMELLKDARTDFAGFELPGAAVTLNVSSKLSDSDVAELKKILDATRAQTMKELESQSLGPEELKIAKQLVGDLFDVVTKTVEAKKADVGMSLMLDPKAITVVAGMAVADAPKLEGVVKKLVEMAGKEEPEVAKHIKLDAETYNGVRMHVASIPLDEEEPKKFFGDNVDMVLGVTDGALYLGMGRDAMKTLKSAIDKSKSQAGKQTAPLKLAVALGPIFKLAAEQAQGPDKQMAIMMAMMLDQAKGKDRISITASVIPDGQRLRIELDEGVLKAIPMMIMLGAAREAPPLGVVPER